MRKLLIAANWKMYKTPTESTAFLTSFYPLVKQSTHAEILLCPAMTSLPALIDAARAAQSVLGRKLTSHSIIAGPIDWKPNPDAPSCR